MPSDLPVSLSLPTDLAQLMGGLDHLLDPTANDAEAHLAEALKHQGQAQGMAVSDREAHLAAQLVLTQRASTRGAEVPRLSPGEIKAYFRLPALEPTAEERAAQRASRYASRRWGRELGQSALGLVMVAGAVGMMLGMRWINQASHLNAAVALGLGAAGAGVAVAGLIAGTVKTILGLVEAAIGQDTSAYDARQQATYVESLDRLPDAQLVQVGEAMRLELAQARADRRFSDVTTTEDQIRAALKRRGLA